MKSHSASLDGAYADQVRRRAERDGLLKDADEAQEEDTKKSDSKAPTEDATATSDGKDSAATPSAEKADSAEKQPAQAEAKAAPVKDEAPPESAPAGKAASQEAAATAPKQEATAPAPAQETAPAPQQQDANSAPKKVVSSKPPAPKRGPAAGASPGTTTTRPTTRPPSQQPPARPAAPAAREGGAPKSAAGKPAGPPPGPPVSRSGKPIPPPPGPPVSRSGKPIPPPPGMGGRGPAPTRSGGPGGRSGPGGGPSRGPRPGGAPSRPAPGGGPSFPPPGGGPPGGPGGGPPGRGRGPGNQQRPPRRKGRRRRNREELQPMDVPTYTPATAPVPEGVVVIERGSTPQDLGAKLNRTAADVVRFLLQQGEMVTATQSLSDEMIELFATEVGAEVSLVDLGEEQEIELQKILEVPEESDDKDDLPHRAPVITVMGHVDHGKTKLLDRIRNANVASGEAGGITQHIGAYQAVKDGKRLTFIDTPGHEAFTAMRARGASATDIVVLVVAADDGVMPQTIEAIQHAKAAEVPIVVAINKIDRETADPNRVMQQLAEHDLVPEAWGGDTIMCEISALQGLGIDELLEQLLLVAEVEDLRATPEGRASGLVLEAHLDIGRGPVASVLVQRGTLRVGDPLVAGPAWGRVRALINDRGEQVQEATPSTPVEVLGLSDVAVAGDDFVIAPDERKARSVAETRDRWRREASRGRDASMSQGAKLEDIFAQIQAGEQATLNLVVKADVQGSLEAVVESLKKLERDEVKIGFVLRGVGGISESDIALAATSSATIIGFNVRPGRQARELAEEEGIEIRTYEIIYKLLEDVEAAMVGMLAPEFEEVVTGEAEVREVFGVPKIGKVAGCMVQSGVITRGSAVRFLREGTIIWKGEISSLRRFKDDVREVAAGFECGVGLSDFQDLKPGDIIETYELREIPRT